MNEQDTKKITMKQLIELCDSASDCHRRYVAIFGGSVKGAEKVYINVLAQYELRSPYERQQELLKNQETLLATQFKDGNLDQVAMYKGILEKMLEDVEGSQYPSERARAAQQVISIQSHLKEMAEKEMREKEEDSIPLALLLDAHLMGISPREIAKLRYRLMNGERDVSKRQADDLIIKGSELYSKFSQEDQDKMSDRMEENANDLEEYMNNFDPNE